MHSSISIHIAHSYCLEMDPDLAECRTWGPNSALARERVPEDDLYFAESLSEWMGKLQHEMAEVLKSCPLAFDETSLLKGMTAGAV